MRLIPFALAAIFAAPPTPLKVPTAPLEPRNPVVKQSPAPRVLSEHKIPLSALSRAPGGGLWCVDVDSWDTSDGKYPRSVRVRRLASDGREVGRIALSKSSEEADAHWLAFSRDGSLMAAIMLSRKPVTPQYSETVSVDVWDLKRRRLKWHLAPRQPEPWNSDDLIGLDFSPSGRELATASGAGVVTQWDMATGKPTRTLDLKARASALAYSPDGSALAVVAKPSVRILDARGLKLRAELRLPKSSQVPEGIGLQTLAWSPDGRSLAANTGTPTSTPRGQSWREEVCVWDVGARRLRLGRAAPRGSGVEGMAWAPDSKRLALARRRYEPLGTSALDVWDVARNRLLVSLGAGEAATEAGIDRPLFSPDGCGLLALSGDKIKAWSLDAAP